MVKLVKGISQCVLGDLGISGSFSTISYKGDNFCDFLFAILHTNPHLKKRVYSKKKIEFAPKGEQILPFYSRPFFRRKSQTVLKELPPLEVYPFP